MESASMCGSRQWASDVWSLSLAAFSFPSPADAPDDWPVGLGRLPPARAPAAACSGIGSIAEVSEVEVLVVGPAVTGPLEVGPAETGPALSANCGSDGRRARVRAGGKRVEGRVCSVTVTAAGLKEAWPCGPEGNSRPSGRTALCGALLRNAARLRRALPGVLLPGNSGLRASCAGWRGGGAQDSTTRAPTRRADSTDGPTATDQRTRALRALSIL